MSEDKTQMRQLVRLIDVDIHGNKPLRVGMCRVKGVSHALANAVCKIKNLDPQKQIGYFTDKELEGVEDVIKNPLKYDIPVFMLNRRRDFETGQDKHIISSEVPLTKELDVKRMRMMRSYKGHRHGKNLPVRGQRTKAHFRHGASLGVAKKKTVSSKPAGK